MRRQWIGVGGVGRLGCNGLMGQWGVGCGWSQIWLQLRCVIAAGGSWFGWVGSGGLFCGGIQDQRGQGKGRRSRIWFWLMGWGYHNVVLIAMEGIAPAEAMNIGAMNGALEEGNEAVRLLMIKVGTTEPERIIISQGGSLRGV